ncbi:MAG: HAD family hydrolase [SAR324 cluster bacterium]|nr:HAD family hydrolase [SAR324 cluster bacterium]
MINRIKATALVKERCGFSLQRHMAHVAQAMEAMCLRIGGGKEMDKWYIIGMLHDIDWEDTISNPKEHCGEKTVKYLLQEDVPADWITVIQAHCGWHDVPLDSDIKKALVAIDELSGFCVAVALMRPTKMVGMKAKSVIKKIKDKHFARNVDRKDMLMVEEYFDIELADLLNQTLLPAFAKIADEWQLV